jgi:hypothetical protein
MNVFSEVELRSKNGTEYLIEQIIGFGNCSTNWVYDKERSNRYSNNLIDAKGCALIYKGSKWNPGFAFSEKKEGHIYLANIVPKETGKISITEYNGLSKSFFEAFKEWSKEQRNGIKISISKTDLELEDIITANVPKKHFQSFLNNYPLSYHPCDIERLDRFICSVARYSRKPINWEYLGEFLLKKKNWSEADVSWCLNRIEIGLDIIRVYKRK